MSTSLANSDPDLDPEKTAVDSGNKLVLSEEESRTHIHNNPEDRTPLYICFAKNDKDNPRNFPAGKKWYITVMAAWLNVVLSMAVSSFALGFDQIASDFNTSHITAVLAGQSIFLIGGGLGPLFCGPLSERYGRRNTFIVSQFFQLVFTIPPPLAKNIATIIVTRFLSGLLGSAAASNSGGTVHDLWVRDESGLPISLYTISTVSTPPFILIWSSYVVMNKGWRDVQWIMLAVTGATLILYISTIPETRHSVILERKAKRVQKEVENAGTSTTVMAEGEDEKEGLGTLFKITLTRPIRFLVSEPIIFFSAVYNGFTFAIVYLFQGSFALIFGSEGHGWNLGEQGLSFLGLLIGTLIGALINPIQDRYYLRRIKEEGKGVPEARMWMAMTGSFLFPISLFWFAWTSYASIQWIVPMIASGFFRIGFYIVLQALLSYVYDAYGSYCSSGYASLLLVRNWMGCFPLFADPMYNNLGFFELIAVTDPFVYFYKGEALRWRSPFAREHFYQKEDSG